MILRLKKGFFKTVQIKILLFSIFVNKKYNETKLFKDSKIIFLSEANILRHFSCEYCDKAIKGGFDPSTNQVRFFFI